jgi:hypothetical protein
MDDRSLKRTSQGRRAPDSYGSGAAEALYDNAMQDQVVCAICGKPGVIVGKTAMQIPVCTDCASHIVIDGDEVYDNRNPTARRPWPGK